ncbi:MAG: hypothetical protein MK108_08350 [Mariniblastus sp.]|nr:hypothetical protein [Mariniblastus sp.]
MSVTTESLKLCRLLWGRSHPPEVPEIECCGQRASDVIFDAIQSVEPCMVSRFGSVELSGILCSIDSQADTSRIQKFKQFVNGESGFYWWTSSLKRRMHINAGFFPPEEQALNRFGSRILDDISQIDVLGSWLPEEQRLSPLLSSATRVPLDDLFPLHHESPWMTALEGQTVLVIHPFATSIEKQYRKRDQLFEDSRVLPRFQLKTLEAIQSAAGETTAFRDWFEALDHMRDQVSRIDFDTAIIGAGAYGMPLAADIKRMGKNAIHLGGITQIMFGVIGNRWSHLSHLFNSSWVRPSPHERPRHAKLVEAACYW